MICLNVLQHADPQFGGIAASVPQLARALDAAGRYRDRNAAFCDEDEQAGPDFVRLPASRRRWVGERLTRRSFDELVSGADVLHVHGLWGQHALSACGAAKRHRKPYVVSAHGMLEPWALGQKRWKKSIYGTLVERRNLRRAACVRALTRQEVSDYRRFGIKTPVAVIPNGIDTPPSPSPEPFLARYPELSDQRLTLFLGRLHPKKGIDILCRAWAAAPRCADDRLVIAGSDFEGTRARIESLIAELGIAANVTFTGLLGPELKWSALAAAHVFVLPSHSEGFSMAVLEALAAGVPAIVSSESNPPDLTNPRCGWVLRATIGPVTDALAEALEMTSTDRARLGENGRRLIQERYTWPTIAAQMAAVYDWVLGGLKPSNLEIFE